MTNYYTSNEEYQKLLKKDQAIIDKMNNGELSFEEGEKQIKELWDVKKREDKTAQ